jgi:hypothetical protein
MSQHLLPCDGSELNDPINCRESVLLVSAWRDDEISPIDRQRLRVHVRACPRCQVAQAQFWILFSALDDLLARPDCTSPHL